jgi:nucleoside-triphosphatase THEP1
MGILFVSEKGKKQEGKLEIQVDELKDKFDDALENLYKKYDVLKEDGQGL